MVRVTIDCWRLATRMISDSVSRSETLIAEYLRGPDKLATLLAPVADETFPLRPSEGRWSIHENLLHLVDMEVVQTFWIRKTLAEDRPQLPAIDQNAWLNRLHYQDRSWRRAFQDLRRLRESNVEILRRLDPTDWAREGIHPE